MKNIILVILFIFLSVAYSSDLEISKEHIQQELNEFYTNRLMCNNFHFISKEHYNSDDNMMYLYKSRNYAFPHLSPDIVVYEQTKPNFYYVTNNEKDIIELEYINENGNKATYNDIAIEQMNILSKNGLYEEKGVKKWEVFKVPADDINYYADELHSGFQPMNRLFRLFTKQKYMLPISEYKIVPTYKV